MSRANSSGPVTERGIVRASRNRGNRWGILPPVQSLNETIIFNYTQVGIKIQVFFYSRHSAVRNILSRRIFCIKRKLTGRIKFFCFNAYHDILSVVVPVILGWRGRFDCLNLPLLLSSIDSRPINASEDQQWYPADLSTDILYLHSQSRMNLTCDFERQFETALEWGLAMASRYTTFFDSSNTE